MIVTADNGLRRSFLGVDFLVLSHGTDTMITKMLTRRRIMSPFISIRMNKADT